MIANSKLSRFGLLTPLMTASESDTATRTHQEVNDALSGEQWIESITLDVFELIISFLDVEGITKLESVGVSAFDQENIHRSD